MWQLWDWDFSGVSTQKEQKLEGRAYCLFCFYFCPSSVFCFCFHYPLLSLYTFHSFVLSSSWNTPVRIWLMSAHHTLLSVMLLPSTRELIQMEKNVWCLKVLEVHLYVEKTKKTVLCGSLSGWLAVSSCSWALMLLEASCEPGWNLRLELVTHRLVLCTVISIDGVLKQPMHQSI